MKIFYFLVACLFIFSHSLVVEAETPPESQTNDVLPAFEFNRQQAEFYAGVLARVAYYTSYCNSQLNNLEAMSIGQVIDKGHGWQPFEDASIKTFGSAVAYRGYSESLLNIFISDKRKRSPAANATLCALEKQYYERVKGLKVKQMLQHILTKGQYDQEPTSQQKSTKE